MRRITYNILAFVIAALIIYMGAGTTILPECCMQEESACIPSGTEHETGQFFHDCHHCSSSHYNRSKKCTCEATIYKEIMVSHTTGSILPLPYYHLIGFQTGTGLQVPLFESHLHTIYLHNPHPPRERQTLLALHQVFII